MHLRKPQVNTEALVDLYTVQHLTVREIGRQVGMSGVGVWKRLQSAGVQASEGERIEVPCFTCGARYSLTRGRWKHAMKHFCSEACYFKALENPAYNPNRNGQRLARKVVSRLFKLEPQHVVHHVDGDDLHNLLPNLWVFSSQSEHMSYHRGGDAQPIWKG